MLRRIHLWVVLTFLLLTLAGCRVREDATSVAPQPTADYGAGVGQQQWLMVMPDDGPDAALDFIRSAQKSIRFKIYLLTFDAARTELIHAAQRGVDVRVLIDREPIGGGESNAESYRILKDGGVNVKWTPGAFKNTHEKSMVVDDRKVLISTFNFTYSSFIHNREYAIVSTQPDVVADVAAIFDADWAGAGVKISTDSPLVVSPENSRNRIVEMIRAAKRELWLEEATLLDEALTDELVRAVGRGVVVRFLAPRRNENDIAQANWSRLLDAGAKVLFLDAPYIHAKAILADGNRAFIGSQNLTFTSLELNRELGIVTEDPAIINRLAKTMAADWQQAGGDASLSAADAVGGVTIIPWQDAESFAGREVTVEGAIVHTYDSGKVTFLNFDEDYHNTLTIVIFSSIYGRFPEKPASYFDGRLVRVTGKVKMYEGSPEIVIDDPAQIQVLDVRSESIPIDDSSASEIGAGPVSWQEAGNFVGERVAVEGDVVRTHNSGKAVFLNFDEDWRGKFSVVIFAGDFHNFPHPPEEMYLRQRIQVTGVVQTYKGAPEIIVDSPEQIIILGQVATPPPSTQVQASASPAQVVSWQDAAQYVGQRVTIEGRIVRTKDIGSITFLNFSQERGQFVAIVWAEDYVNFPAPPAELYAGKKVWVTGEISTYKGVPQIVVHSPEQLEVFD